MIGLTFLWNAYRNNRLKQVYVYGEEDKLEAIKRHVFSELIFPAIPNIEWKVIRPNASFVINDSAIETFSLDHPGGSMGYLVETNRRKLAYVTDTVTDDTKEYWSKISTADLLIHECNFGASEAEFAKRTGHTDFGNLRKSLVKYLIKRVLLTHFDTINDDLSSEVSTARDHCSDAFHPQIMLAEDGMVIEY